MFNPCKKSAVIILLHMWLLQILVSLLADITSCRTIFAASENGHAPSNFGGHGSTFLLVRVEGIAENWKHKKKT